MVAAPLKSEIRNQNNAGHLNRVETKIWRLRRWKFRQPGLRFWYHNGSWRLAVRFKSAHCTKVFCRKINRRRVWEGCWGARPAVVPVDETWSGVNRAIGRSERHTVRRETDSCVKIGNLWLVATFAGVGTIVNAAWRLLLNWPNRGPFVEGRVADCV